MNQFCEANELPGWGSQSYGSLAARRATPNYAKATRKKVTDNRLNNSTTTGTTGKFISENAELHAPPDYAEYGEGE